MAHVIQEIKLDNPNEVLYDSYRHLVSIIIFNEYT